MRYAMSIRQRETHERAGSCDTQYARALGE